MPRLFRSLPSALVPRRWRILAERRYRAALQQALRGRRVVVTGASSGIGRAFALQAGAAGADVVLVARRREELERVAQEVERLGGRARVHVADLSDAADAAELAATILREHGPVEVLVNNAGRSVRRSIRDTKPQDFERLIATNFLGPLALTCGLLPAMLERGSGHVIQISTIGVQTGAPNFAAYVSAKAAADHFARTLALEYGGRGIDVTTVQVPLVRTPMMAPTRVYEAFPASSADKAARTIGRAVIGRPVRIAPLWSTLLQLLYALAPGLVHGAFHRLHDPFHALMARRLERMDRRRD